MNVCCLLGEDHNDNLVAFYLGMASENFVELGLLADASNDIIKIYEEMDKYNR